MSDGRCQSTWRWLWVALVIVLAFGVRFYRLGSQSFWIDEAFQVQLAARQPGEIIRGYDPHADWLSRDQAPLSFLVLHPFLSAEHAEWSARLPSAVFGVCDVAAVFLVAALLLPYPTALLAALLIAGSPLHVWYSQEARWYAQWEILTTFSYFALLQAWRSGSRLAWASYALMALLNIYTFIFSLFVTACQSLTAWWLSRFAGTSRRFLVTFAGVQLCVIVAAAPVFRMALGHIGMQTGTPRPTTPAALAYTVYAYAVGFTLGPPLAYLHALPGVLRSIADYPIVVLVGLIFVPLVGLGVRSVLRRPLAAAVLIPWLCGPALAVFVLTLSTNVTYQVRYSIVALPAFVMTVASGVRTLRPGWLRWGALFATAGCTLAALGNYYWDPRYGKEDVRDALAHVRKAGIAGAAILPVGQIELAVIHYGRGLDVLPAGSCVHADGGGRAPAGMPRVLWVIVGRDWEAEGSRCLAQLSRSYASVAEERFPGIALWLLQQRNDERVGNATSPAANFCVADSGCTAAENVVRASANLGGPRASVAHEGGADKGAIG